MRQSQLFCRTKKEISKEIQIISHQLLLKADFISQVAAGIYNFLPLGWRVHRKIEKIIREEMTAIGGQELYLPALIPKNLWDRTGRWQTINPPLFKVKDRHEAKFGLSSTHEEVITELACQRIKSYRDLPLYLFQIQNKFRNEMRSTGGLLRTREFVMKDLYSFHSDEKDLANFYDKIKKAYFRIFKKCGLNPVCVEASSGTIGGKLSHEFMIISPIGEDKVLICKKCGFGANIEKAGKMKKCPKCKNPLEENSSIEIGHIFNLGTKYSKAMGANFIDKDKKVKPIVMGCYGIGLGRLMAVIIEENYDERGIIWPETIAPFDVHLISIFSGEEKIDKKIKEISEKLYKSSFTAGANKFVVQNSAGKIGQKKEIEVLYDDRKEISPGEKFVEADLIGIPIRIVISERTLKNDSVEIKKRTGKETELVKIENIL